MIFWDNLICHLVFAVMGMRIIQLPVSSHEHPLWFGAMNLVCQQYFMAILCIPVQTVSCQNEWIPHAFKEWDICVLQTCLWQICYLWMKYLSLFYIFFTLIFCIWVFLMNRNILRRLGEFCPLHPEKKGVEGTHVYMHMHACVQIYACMCVHTCVLIYVHTHAPCVCVCVCGHLWACACVCSLHISWSILYPSGVSEGIRILSKYNNRSTLWVPCFKHHSRHLILTTPNEVGTVAIPHFQMRKLKHRKVKKLSWGHSWEMAKLSFKPRLAVSSSQLAH